MGKILFLIPYFLSLFISVWITLYAWRHRKVQGAGVYAIYVAGQSLWVFAYILELLAPSLTGKIVWDAAQWIAGLSIMITFPIFAVQYADIKLPKPKLLFKLSFLLPSFFLIALLTDNYHHLYYPNPSLDHRFIFAELTYDFTWLIYFHSIYAYIVTLTGAAILIRRLLRPHRLYRQQIIAIILGFLFPIVFTAMTTFGVKFFPFRDISPFTFAIGNIIVAWGLFRYSLFDVVPIARDLVLDNIEDLVIVIDIQDRIVDMNQKALKALNMTSMQVIGHPAREIYRNIPNLLERFQEPKNLHVKTSIKFKKKLYHYDVTSTLLYDKENRFVGRVFVANDITAYIEIQEKLKSLNDELEERVQKRTQELSQSMERYRAVVEHQTEFIVRWKPDRTRTFVNEAYCRYYDLTMEEALSQDFLTTILEEDRPAAKEKIKRLLSGEANAEATSHRVINPDGSISWQEWTDQIIRDKSGEVLEIQSVGRDVTAAKQVAISLQKSEKRHRLLFESANDSIFVIQGDRFVDCNSKTLEVFRCTREEIIHKRPSDLAPKVQPTGENSEEKAAQKINAALQGTSQFFEWQHRRPDQTIFDAEVSLNLLELENETFVQAIVRDITDRKHAENSLMLSEEKFSKAFNTSPVLMTIEDDKGSFIDVNQAFLDAFGLKREEAIGRKATDLNFVYDTDDLTALRKVYQEQGFLKDFEARMRRKSGEISVVSLSSDDFYMNGVKHIVTSGLDITERKETERILEEAYNTTLEGWARALELRDKETEGHTRRVTDLTLKLAQACGIHQDELGDIQRGAILHDIGKLAISDNVLLKPNRLDQDEWRIMSQHPWIGYKLLSPIGFLQNALDIVLYHHEKWDGSGYPKGLRGEEIPLYARIFAVVDVWDAVQSERPYKKSWSREKAINLIKNGSGNHFDPAIVDIFIDLVKRGEIAPM